MISLSDFVKRQNALNNIFANSNKTVYLSTNQILRLLSIGVYYNKVVRELIFSALNRGNISSYRPNRILSGPLIKKRVRPFKLPIRNYFREIDISKSNASQSSSLVPLLDQYHREDSIFSTGDNIVGPRFIAKQKNLNFNKPIQGILQRTIDKAFTLIKPFQDNKLSIFSNALLNKETTVYPDNKLSQLFKPDGDNLIDKNTSVMMPSFDIASRTLPSAFQSIHTMNKFFNDAALINKLKIFPGTLSNYSQLQSKAHERMISNGRANVARTITNSTENIEHEQITSDSLDHLKLNESPVVGEQQAHWFDSLFPHFPSSSIQAENSIPKVLTYVTAPTNSISTTISSLLSNGINLSNVIDRIPSINLIDGLSKNPQDSIVLDSDKIRLALPTIGTKSYQVINPFKSTFEHQHYINSILPLGVLNNTAFQSGELLKTHFSTGLNIAGLQNFSGSGPLSMFHPIKRLSRFSHGINEISSRMVSENYPSIPDSLLPSVPNISAHFYTDHISTMTNAQSTLSNMLSISTQNEPVIPNQYAEASVASSKEYLSEKSGLANEIADDFNIDTDALQIPSTAEAPALDHQLPRLDQIISANQFPEMIPNILSELKSITTHLESTLPFLSTFNLKSLFPSFHRSAFAHLAKNGLSHIIRSPFTMGNIQNKFVLPSLSEIIKGKYYQTAIQGPRDISADKSDFVSKTTMGEAISSLYVHGLPGKMVPNTVGPFGHILGEHLSNKNIDWRPLINTAYYGTTGMGGGASQNILPLLSRQMMLAKSLNTGIQSQELLTKPSSTSVNRALGSLQSNRHILANDSLMTENFPVTGSSADFGSVHLSTFSSVIENEQGITSEESDELELRSLGTKIEQIFNDELRKYGISHDQLSSHYHNDMFGYTNDVEQNEQGITSEESDELELRSLGTKIEQIFNDELRKYGY